jgi:hypothetical protein
MEIKGCEVTQVFEVTEMITATEDEGSFMFREKLIIFHEPSFEWANVIILAIIFVLLLPVVYALLYNFRKRKCEVCDKQLVWSSKKCMVCKFFHADAPDPILRHAIESKVINPSDHYLLLLFYPYHYVSNGRSTCELLRSQIWPNLTLSLHYRCHCRCRCVTCTSQALHLNDVEPPKFPLIHAVKNPGERMDALASAEQLYFHAVKDSIRQELKDQAAAEEKAGAHRPIMHLPKDTTGDKVNGEGDSRKAYKGERLHHLTPVDAEEVRLLVEDIARRRWKELAIDERLVYEDMEAEIAHKAHRLHQVCNSFRSGPCEVTIAIMQVLCVWAQTPFSLARF